jgi:RHS repeat-associated protein
MTGIADKNSSDTTLVSYGYTYNAAGLVSQETRTWASGSSTDTLTYGYTNNDQLTSVTHTNSSFSSESFSYDANGNETGTGFTTTTGNEQTASPGFTYTYDADGNMITSTNTSTHDVWTYTYNFLNLMTGAVEKTSTGTVLAQVTYTYDALDNRIGMDENGTQTWTLYDGSDPVMDFNSSGSLEMRYLNGPTGDLVDTVIARESSGGTVAWYLPDRLGTIRDLINNSGGIIDHVDYSAFGTVLDESSPTNGDRMMGFAGSERDTVAGLNLAVNRVENPGTGRWTSQDPLGFAAGDANLYRYVGNGPVYDTDKSGLEPWGWQTWLGTQVLYPAITTVTGNNGLAGASDTQLFRGTAVGATALVVGGRVLWRVVPKLKIVVTEGEPFHVIYTAGGPWLHGSGRAGPIVVRTIGTSKRLLDFFETAKFGFQVPILFPRAAGAIGQPASSCVGAAFKAFARGWLPFLR